MGDYPVDKAPAAMVKINPSERDDSPVEITEEMIRAGQEAWAEWAESDDGIAVLATNVYRRMRALEPGFQKSGSGDR